MLNRVRLSVSAPRASLTNLLVVAALVTGCAHRTAPTVAVSTALPPGEPVAPIDIGGACKRTVDVANAAALASALTAAAPGDCLVLADGDYKFPEITQSGTAEAPIQIRAAHRLRAVIREGWLVFASNSYVVVEGLTFASADGIKFRDAHHCRLTRCRISPSDTPKVEWVDVQTESHHIRVDHCDFGPKSHVGNMVMLGGKNGQVVQHNQIDHNYFHDIQYGGGNGWETIRAGLSFLAPSRAFSVIEYNLFQNTGGDPETISIKSSDNEIRYNTFRHVPGQLTLRHGNRNHVYGNYIIDGEGGMRICGSEHLIYNNYVANVKSKWGIWLEGGDGDGIDVPGKQHYRVYRTKVVNNTVVGNTIKVGGGHPLEPVDCTIANNLSAGIEEGGTGTSYAGNVTDARVPVEGKIEKLATGSPAIGAEVGSYDFVKDDIDGQARGGTTKLDVGADQISNAPVLHRPLTEADVGPDAP